MAGQGLLLPWVEAQRPLKPWGLLLPPPKEPQDRLTLPLSGPAPRAAAARQSPWGLQLWQGLGRDHSPQMNIQVILNPEQLQRPTV